MGLPVSRIAVAALSALAATAACAVPASAESGGNMITVEKSASISQDGRVTLSGEYRCQPGSPEGVQIQTQVRQDGNKLGMTAGADCDGAVHAWSATGSIGVDPGFHPGDADADARLTVARIHGAALVPSAISQSTLAQDGRHLTIEGH
ncbi:DUF6299 family protein [Streptomyces sp. NBC_00536]|uniref:DUF6299 family protein n=1 Tax=Streptomyces sp. NBC_00536 TaxID=2975769 RepID=UPI002E811817|nr:DUF6299 family protein [Streptomyces sp. NBC_00536]WUC79537.1 DUF6299 family protein [Streptomyces sp. NBC_00536]